MPSQRFLKRHIVPSDDHHFVGRIYDLSIVSLHFDSYEHLCSHPDAKYALEVNLAVKGLVQRVETLNLVGDLLWPDPFPEDFNLLPISRFQWLTVAADVFLARYISIVDCASLVVNEVFEAELEARRCSIANLQRSGVSPSVIAALEALVVAQGELRNERNERFHHGRERGFTDDDLSFEFAATFELGNSVTGHDRHGRPLNPKRSFKLALRSLQEDYNTTTRSLVKDLDALYDLLRMEFEKRFVPRFRAGAFSQSRDQQGA